MGNSILNKKKKVKKETGIKYSNPISNIKNESSKYINVIPDRKNSHSAPKQDKLMTLSKASYVAENNNVRNKTTKIYPKPISRKEYNYQHYNEDDYNNDNDLNDEYTNLRKSTQYDSRCKRPSIKDEEKEDIGIHNIFCTKPNSDERKMSGPTLILDLFKAKSNNSNTSNNSNKSINMSNKSINKANINVNNSNNISKE